MATMSVEDHRRCPFRYKDCEYAAQDIAYCTIGPWFCYGDRLPEACPLRSGSVTVELSAKEQHGSSR